MPTTDLASSYASPVSFCHFKTSPEIIQNAVMLYVRFPLSLRNLEDLLHERGVYVGYEYVQLVAQVWLSVRKGDQKAKSRGYAVKHLEVAP